LIENSDIFHTPPALDAPVTEGPSRNIAMRFGVEKTKLAWLPDGEKNDDMTTRFDAVSERDEQTDGHRTTAWEAFMHSIARQQKLESLK